MSNNNEFFVVPFVVSNDKNIIIESSRSFNGLCKCDVVGENVKAIISDNFDDIDGTIIDDAIINHNGIVNVMLNNIKFVLKISKQDDQHTKYIFNYVMDIKHMYHILENVIVGFVVAGDDMKIRYINKEITKIFGYTRDEVIGKKVTILMPKEIASEHHTYVENYKKTGMSKIIYHGKRSVIGKKKDGSLFEVYLAINEHWDSSGRFFIASFGKLERDFDKSFFVFEDLAKYNSTFMANMSHEIRTPVNGIYGVLDMLKGTALNEIQKYYVDICYASSKNLIKILDDMLLYTKSKQGGIELSLETFDITELVEDTLSVMYLNVGKTKNINLVHYIHSDVPTFLIGDTKLLRRVIQHIVSNAIKFTEIGEIEVEVEKSYNNVIKFSISDTGIGMRSEQMDKLFIPFTQLESGTTKKYKGTGLGLSICKLLVQFAGGEIYATSKYGRGSTFIFTMKLVTDKIANENGLDMYHHKKIVNKKICVIDDNATNCMALHAIFKQFGMEVRTFRSVKDGINFLKVCKLQNEMYDLVIMDYHMPDIDGLEACQALLRSNIHLDVIMLSSITSYEIPTFQQQLKECPNIKYCMSKPILKKQMFNVMIKYFNGEYDNYIDPTGKTNLSVKIEDEIDKFSIVDIAKNKNGQSGVKNKIILVADDNELNRNIMHIILEKYGYVVHDAINGLEAVDIVEKNNYYHAIFMDIHMPILNGLDATKILIERGYNIPVIAITADVTPEMKANMDEVGFYDYIYKPANVNKIMTSLRAIVPNKKPVKKSTKPIQRSKTIDYSDSDSEDFGGDSCLRVIIVDDNFVNMIIFDKYLTLIAQELDIEIVKYKFTNGQEVCDYYLGDDVKYSIDCIFMDIEMPVMNGYQATKKIRETDQMVPIIGVTGHDELNYRDLFTDQIVKPVSMEKVRSIVENFVLKKREDKNLHKYINSEIVSGLKNLGEDVVVPILNQWKEDIKQKVKEIRKHVDEKDHESTKFAGHYIKGSSYQLGCSVLGNLFKKLEEEAVKKNDDQLEQLITEIEKAVPDTIEFLNVSYSFP